MSGRRAELSLKAKHNRATNEWYTPEYATGYILPFVKGFSSIWEPCCGQGHIARELESAGHVVIATDIAMGAVFDVFTHTPTLEYDAIVTNPPFRGKTQLLARLFGLDKPFAVLMPTQVLESKPIRDMLKDHAGQWGMVVPPRTINYINSEDPGRYSRSFFHSSWLTYKLPVAGVVLL